MAIFPNTSNDILCGLISIFLWCFKSHSYFILWINIYRGLKEKVYHRKRELAGEKGNQLVSVLLIEKIFYVFFVACYHFFSNFQLDSWCIVSVKGLGLVPGVVGRFNSSNGFRVPHIGWNALQIAKDSEILDEIGDRHVYFVHSYRAMPVCSSLCTS